MTGGGFAELARARRVEARIKLREVARRLGYTPAYVSDVERANRRAPSPDVARRWADALGADADEFEVAARLDRKVVELPIGEGHGEHDEAAVLLARRWSGLSVERVEEVMQILRRDDGE